MSDLVKGYTDFVGEEPNGHPYEVYHADDVQEVLQAKDARIAELEKALRLIAEHKGKALLGDGRYDEGANAAFNQMADIAASVL